MITRREIDELAAATGFSGVVRIDRGGQVELAAAYGFADRAHEVPNTLETQFAVASATKGLTALVVVNLVMDGVLELSTPARSLLGDDLPLIDDAVTVEHLLAHRSGIGDYVDEDEDIDPLAYLMPVPVHELATTEDYLRVLDGHPAKFAPGERFSYCNSGYVVLALIDERATGVPFHELVQQRVSEPAGMRDTAFLRSDELPGRAAIGYLDGDGRRTNVFHLPVRGSGDGGAYTTLADINALWSAFFDGRIVPSDWVAEMVRPRSATSDGRRRYGLGFWLAGEGDAVSLVGADAGVSFRSVHDPARDLTHTMISNTTDAWQVSRLLAANA
jgi:CubicO group peptidase (beta-lactamase class C family)